VRVRVSPSVQKTVRVLIMTYHSNWEVVGKYTRRLLINIYNTNGSDTEPEIRAVGFRSVNSFTGRSVLEFYPKNSKKGKVS